MTDRLRSPQIEPEEALQLGEQHSGRRRAGWSSLADSQIEVDLARVWAELTSGRWRIVDTFVTEQRCHAVLEPTGCDRGGRGLLSKNRVKTLESLLLGESRKAIALRQNVNVRSVTANASQALRGIGCCSRLSRLPMALFTLVHAAYELTDLTKGEIAAPEGGESQYRLLAIERVDECVGRMLSPAEAAVTKLFMGGESHDEIAKLRNTARHTIANQMTATFHKFGVSGRIELLCLLHHHPKARKLRATSSALIAQPLRARTMTDSRLGADGAMILDRSMS